MSFPVAGAFLMVLGSAMLFPAAASPSPSTTASFQSASSAEVHPVMWIDCSAMSWWERLWTSYC